jgi:hypothetical protein
MRLCPIPTRAIRAQTDDDDIDGDDAPLIGVE